MDEGQADEDMIITQNKTAKIKWRIIWMKNVRLHVVFRPVVTDDTINLCGGGGGSGGD